MRGLSLVAASGGHSSSRCAGLSLSWPLVVEHRLQMRRLSSCGSGLVAPRHVGSSQTRVRARVPFIGRQILNHCTTREALNIRVFDSLYFFGFYRTISFPVNSRLISDINQLYNYISNFFTCLAVSQYGSVKET